MYNCIDSHLNELRWLPATDVSLLLVVIVQISKIHYSLQSRAFGFRLNQPC